MYLAVSIGDESFCFTSSLTYFVACILHISPPHVLSITIRPTGNQELSCTSERRHCRICCFSRAFCPHGSNAATIIALVSFHPGTQSCLLGTKCMGTSYCRRSCSFEMFVRISTTYLFTNLSFRCEEQWKRRPYKPGGCGFNIQRACWGYSLCSDPKCEAYTHVHHHHSFTNRQ